MKTPIEVFLAVAGLGGKLGIVEGDALRTLLPPDSPPALKATIRAHKTALLELLRLNFLIVRSDVLDATLFWTSDEATKESLVAAGADPSSIYTKRELEQLVHRRVTVGELPLLHAARKRFNGKVTEP